MKNLIAPLLLTLLILASCKSKPSKPVPVVTRDTIPSVCDFGIEPQEFNMTKRVPVENELVSRNKPRPIKPPPTPTVSGGVLLLDFDGHTVMNTNWNMLNGGQAIVCANANLSTEAMQLIYDSAVKKYARWKILVTTDETLYNAAPANRRMRVVFTESWELFGRSGGTSLIGSFTWGSNTPCFVFTSLLNYNVKQIMEAGIHEPGHTFGLYHQGVWVNGVKTSEYDYGSDNCCIAPIMGCAYYKNMSVFRTGLNAYGTSVNEIQFLDNLLGVK